MTESPEQRLARLAAEHITVGLAHQLYRKRD
jgi:hypothetical protein